MPTIQFPTEFSELLRLLNDHDVKKCTTHIENAPTVDKTSGRDYGTGPLNKSQNRSYQSPRATRLMVPTITVRTALHDVLSVRQQLRPHNESEDIAPLYFADAGTHPGAVVPGVLSVARVLDSPAELRSVYPKQLSAVA